MARTRIGRRIDDDRRDAAERHRNCQNEHNPLHCHLQAWSVNSLHLSSAGPAGSQGIGRQRAERVVSGWRLRLEIRPGFRACVRRPALLGPLWSLPRTRSLHPQSRQAGCRFDSCSPRRPASCVLSVARMHDIPHRARFPLRQARRQALRSRAGRILYAKLLSTLVEMALTTTGAGRRCT